jgi:DNA polymerase-3 subunit gamma/tau
MDAEGITVGDESLQLIARDAEGSMRDAQSKLDQVIAFTGKTIGSEDVATVLGLVGRDLLLDTLQAVADEDAPASFALAARAVEMGYDLRAVCRELSRVVRDLLVLSVDPSRIADPEIAGEGERDRLKGLVARFSREDLLRAFDLLTRAEQEIRGAAQPRYHLEMALLRWMHLRKLMPIEDLIAGAGSGTAQRGALRSPETAAPQRGAAGADVRRAPLSAVSGAAPPAPVARPTATAPSRPEPSSPLRAAAAAAVKATAARPSAPAASPASVAPAAASVPVSGNFKDALLAEIRKSKAVLYNMVVAQAQKIEVAGDRITFTFAPMQRALRDTLEQNRAWLETTAQQITGRKIAIASAQSDAATVPAADSTAAADKKSTEKKTALREQALADAGVQTMLEVFPAEIRDVEEM